MGRFFPEDWFQIVFNPSFPYRLAHTVVGFYVTTGFVVIGVAAYLIRDDRFMREGRIMLSMTLWLLSVLVPLQIFVGDLHGLNTLKHQPAPGCHAGSLCQRFQGQWKGFRWDVV
jgi:cytochrome bd ubiquinol oxidase subunit I